MGDANGVEKGTVPGLRWAEIGHCEEVHALRKGESDSNRVPIVQWAHGEVRQDVPAVSVGGVEESAR